VAAPLRGMVGLPSDSGNSVRSHAGRQVRTATRWPSTACSAGSACIVGKPLTSSRRSRSRSRAYGPSPVAPRANSCRRAPGHGRPAASGARNPPDRSCCPAGNRRDPRRQQLFHQLGRQPPEEAARHSSRDICIRHQPRIRHTAAQREHRKPQDAAGERPDRRPFGWPPRRDHHKDPPTPRGRPRPVMDRGRAHGFAALPRTARLAPLRGSSASSCGRRPPTGPHCLHIELRRGERGRAFPVSAPRRTRPVRSHMSRPVTAQYDVDHSSRNPIRLRAALTMLQARRGSRSSARPIQARRLLAVNTHALLRARWFDPGTVARRARWTGGTRRSPGVCCRRGGG